MIKMKRFLALGLAGVLAAGCFTGCGNNSGDSTSKGYYRDGKRVIRIGTWYTHYYDSTNEDIYDDASVTDEELAQKHFDVVAEVEETYGVEIEFVNLTWEGVMSSINNSILAGNPDCDIYEVSLQFGTPAAVNGLALDLTTILPEDSDIFTDNNVMRYIDIGTEGVYLFSPSSREIQLAGTYMLAYNKDMLDEAGLEDPNDLAARGEWTWDKWREYMLALTQDTDHDGTTDVYGYGGCWTYMMDNMLMSNGTNIASGTTQNLDSAEVGEVLEFVYNMYNVDHTARPWNDQSWDDNQNAYQKGSVAFWITAAWISDANQDVNLDFEIGWCPWPIGPSGNAETNYTKNEAANGAYIIPSCVEDPELVYNVFYAWCNWYHDDTELRDSDLHWWEDAALTEENYQVMVGVSENATVDLWQSIGVEFNFLALLGVADTELMTPAQWQETYKQSFQDALDAMFNK